MNSILCEFLQAINEWNISFIHVLCTACWSIWGKCYGFNKVGFVFKIIAFMFPWLCNFLRINNIELNPFVYFILVVHLSSSNKSEFRSMYSTFFANAAVKRSANFVMHSIQNSKWTCELVQSCTKLLKYWALFQNWPAWFIFIEPNLYH